MKYITGILVLNNSKTYGRFKNKRLYKCLPSDKKIPAFKFLIIQRFNFLKIN